jgi:hypothetical protein
MTVEIVELSVEQWRLAKQRRLEMTDAKSVKQWLAIRKEEAPKIDPATAEVACWYAQMIDPYGLLDPDSIDPQYWGWQREWFARRPGSDIWVLFDDLPEETWDALRSVMRAK